MTHSKSLDNLIFLEKLIRQKRTGTPKQLARRLSVSPATIHRMVDNLRFYGIIIVYCPILRSYRYDGDKVLDFIIKTRLLTEMTKDEMMNTSGGTKIFFEKNKNIFYTLIF